MVVWDLAWKYNDYQNSGQRNDRTESVPLGEYFQSMLQQKGTDLVKRFQYSLATNDRGVLLTIKRNEIQDVHALVSYLELIHQMDMVQPRLSQRLSETSIRTLASFFLLRTGHSKETDTEPFRFTFAPQVSPENKFYLDLEV